MKPYDLKIEYKKTVMKFALPANDHISKCMYQNGLYELGLLQDTEQYIEKDSVVFDIGACIGSHTVFWGKVCNASVYAFEPNPDAMEYLKNNVELNKITNYVFPKPGAIGAEFGSGQLNQRFGNMGCASLLGRNCGNIPIKPLDEYSLIENISIIKIDVEGMEMEVLRGAKKILKEQSPVLYIETIDKERMDDYLKKIGYKNMKRFNYTPTYKYEKV